MSTGVIFPEGVFPINLFSGFPALDSTPSATYASIRYTWEENLVYQQYTGTTVIYPFQVLDSSGNVVETLTAPEVAVKVNNATATVETFTLTTFDSTMGTFTIEVPYTINGTAMTAGDIAEIAIVDTGVGRGHLVVQFISSEVTATGGSESVITSYTLDASEKTIDTTDATLTIEQIKYILNLTTGNEIYDSSNPRKRRLQMTAPADQVGIDISITSGVISYIESSAMEDTDKIKIVIESAHV